MSSQVSETSSIMPAEDLPCAICLSDFKDTDEETEIIILPCKAHFFHVECIESWLKNNSVCPICRMQVTNANLKEQKKELEKLQKKIKKTEKSERSSWFSSRKSNTIEEEKEQLL
mmetsp:Transcript_42946/g.58319  ORF Transcript_42946/g.58319 Transcript_42946/m.58319 type:complete len:115 (+) Transcript_42946:1022-1366(+)